MAAQEDDLVGLLRAADFAHHVGRRRVVEEVGIHLETQRNLLATLRHPVEAIRVFGGDRGGGDPGNAILIAHAAKPYIKYPAASAHASLSPTGTDALH